MLKNSDLPAVGMDLDAAKEADEGYYNQHVHGLTKREHFAGMALVIAGQEYIAGIGIVHGREEGWERYIAVNAVRIADLLLEELGKDDG